LIIRNIGHETGCSHRFVPSGAIVSELLALVLAFEKEDERVLDQKSLLCYGNVKLRLKRARKHCDPSVDSL
jgi:hypothetical protein